MLSFQLALQRLPPLITDTFSTTFCPTPTPDYPTQPVSMKHQAKHELIPIFLVFFFQRLMNTRVTNRVSPRQAASASHGWTKGLPRCRCSSSALLLHLPQVSLAFHRKPYIHIKRHDDVMISSKSNRFHFRAITQLTTWSTCWTLWVDISASNWNICQIYLILALIELRTDLQARKSSLA